MKKTGLLVKNEGQLSASEGGQFCRIQNKKLAFFPRILKKRKGPDLRDSSVHELKEKCWKTQNHERFAFGLMNAKYFCQRQLQEALELWPGWEGIFPLKML